MTQLLYFPNHYGKTQGITWQVRAQGRIAEAEEKWDQVWHGHPVVPDFAVWLDRCDERFQAALFCETVYG